MFKTPGSIALYGKADTATPDIERRFFTKLRLPNGTYKTTYRHRLDDVNEKVVELLPRGRCLKVMDIGVSAGFSTMEWSDHLTEHGIDHQLVASDLVTEGTLTSWSTWLAVLFDSSESQPLMLEIGGLMVPILSDRWSARVVRPMMFGVLRAIAAAGRRWGNATPMAPAVPGRWVHRSVPLTSPELGRRSRIKVVQDDITLPGNFLSGFDVIRIANLLQRVYFSDDVLRKLIVNVRERLRDGGTVIICRTMDDGVNHATMFRREGQRLVPVASVNGGTEVEGLVYEL